MRTLVRRLTTLLSIFPLLAGSLPGLIVVCVGEDGHVQFEFAVEALRTSEESVGPVYASIRESCWCGDDCGPCEDSRLGFGEVTARRVPFRDQSAASAGLARAAHGAYAAQLPALSFLGETLPPLPNPQQFTLRGTVVLLI